MIETRLHKKIMRDLKRFLAKNTDFGFDTFQGSEYKLTVYSERYLTKTCRAINKILMLDLYDGWVVHEKATNFHDEDSENIVSLSDPKYREKVLSYVKEELSKKR